MYTFIFNVYLLTIFLMLKNSDSNTVKVKPSNVGGLIKDTKTKPDQFKVSKLRDVAINAVVNTTNYYSTLKVLTYSIGAVMNLMLWFGINKDASVKHKHIQYMADDVSKYSNIPGKLRVYITPDDDTINAFTGTVSTSNPWVAVSSGLIKKLNDKEICHVIAHEVGHITHSDTHREIAKFSILQGICGALGLSPNVIKVANIVYYYFNRMLGQRREYLADYHAATIVGPQVSIDATKKVYKLNHEESISSKG